MIAAYLHPYGYVASDLESWTASPRTCTRTPRLDLVIKGHCEMHGHTFYDVKCSLTAQNPTMHLEWHTQQRLVQLREGLHDVVKSELGKRYTRVFGDAPFAKRGGLGGTTDRLQRWLETLVGCVNDGVAPPNLVSQILLFLDAPAQPEHHDAAERIPDGNGSADGGHSDDHGHGFMAEADDDAHIDSAREDRGVSSNGISEIAYQDEMNDVSPLHHEPPRFDTMGEFDQREQNTLPGIDGTSAPESPLVGTPCQAPPDLELEAASAAVKSCKDEGPNRIIVDFDSSDVCKVSNSLGAAAIPCSTPQMWQDCCLSAPTSSEGGHHVPRFLEPYGYAAQAPDVWLSSPLHGPHWDLRVDGHSELDNHTYYHLQCTFSSQQRSLHMQWTCYRQLSLLRLELHDVAKRLLGKSYAEVFSDAPFARRGAPSGTTERLQKWLRSLAWCVNRGLAPPALVAQLLHFLQPPVQSIGGGGGAAAPSVIAEVPVPRKRESRSPLARVGSHDVSTGVAASAVAMAAATTPCRDDAAGITAAAKAEHHSIATPSKPWEQSRVAAASVALGEDTATDDESGPTGAERRRAGYMKLQQWFRELRRALEKRALDMKAKREGSRSPRQCSEAM